MQEIQDNGLKQKILSGLIIYKKKYRYILLLLFEWLRQNFIFLTFKHF